MKNGSGHPIDTSHPAWVRITHWLNAAAVIVMIGSGWQIYDASPIFRGIFFSRRITIGGWLGGGLQWHFAAMWLFVANGLFYLIMNIVTGRFRRKYWPLDWRELWRDIGNTARFKLSHDDLNKYNMIQKLLYMGVTAALIVMVLSGLVLWKSVQFPTLRVLFGGYDTARIVHFASMGCIVGFLAVHVALSLLVPRTLKGMVLGKF